MRMPGFPLVGLRSKTSLVLYPSPKWAYAIANFGSISTARRKKGIAAALPDEKFTFIPVL